MSESDVTGANEPNLPPNDELATPTNEASPSPESPESDRPRASERLKIGSQRDEWSPPPLAPMPTPPATISPPAASEEVQSPAADETSEIAPVAQPEPEAPPAEVVPQRATRHAPEAKHYPPPNVRARLSPELEAELEAALEGQSLDDLISSSASDVQKEIPEGTRMQGTVAKIYQDNVFVDLGVHQQGVIAAKNFEAALPEIGGPLDVNVVKFLADDGLYELSLPHAAVDVGNWDDVEEGQIVEVTITGANKGGLECQVANLRGFMPMGQISIYRVENPEEYVGQRLACVITEANRERRNLVLSHRAVMERQQAENKERLLKELEPGQLRDGTVRSVRDFGAFVDLGGIDGMIHVSKMSWDRIKHPSEVLTEGQAVKVKIDRIDPETGKISLSYRDSATNPWDGVEGKYPIGTRVNGTVSKIMDFGAFVRLEAGVEGLIHISELAHGRVFRTSDVLSEGQSVEVKVQSVDREKQRISLSLKALLEPPKKKGEKDQVDDEDLIVPAEPPKGPRKKAEQLKGGTGGPTGGDKFGLKW